MKTNKVLPGIMQHITLVLFMMFFTSAGAAFAQHDGTGRGGGGGGGGASAETRAKRQTDFMKDRLTLTTVQEPKVYAVALKYAKKMDEAMAITDAPLRSKTVQANDKAKDAELKALLTADQFKEYLKLKEEVKARRRPH
jgi:hypothetical protein